MNSIIKKIAVILCIVLCAFLFSCIFSPQEGEKKSVPHGKWQDPIAPGKVIENLEVAFNNLDIDFYERCLHPNYFYESPSETDSLNVESWSRSTDVQVVGLVFEDCTTMVFNPNYISLVKEYGKNIPDIPSGERISDEHPDEIWYKYNYDISMDLYLKKFGEKRIHQFMQFVMVKDNEGKWSIIRWIDETSISE